MSDIEIPGYTIERTLGKGGMATVYLAIQESFQREVAVKVMSAAFANDPSFGERFQREARIVSRLHHPNIVQVYDVGVVGDHHYLSMEYIPGKELRDRRHELTFKEKMRVVKEVANALDYASKKGYVHRDVKPENIMLNEEDGRAILMDFGIARTTDANHSMTKTGIAVGTPYYMSPEQAQGKPVDNRSDLYSLGVVLFQLLAGYVPFDAEAAVAIGIKHLTEPVPQLPDHVKIFQPIVDKAMAKKPGDRYQIGAEFRAALDAIDPATLDAIQQLQTAGLVRTGTKATDPNAPTTVTSALSSSDIPVLSQVTQLKPGVVVELGRRTGEVGRRSGEQALLDRKKPVRMIALVSGLALAGGAYFLSQPKFSTTQTNMPVLTQPGMPAVAQPPPEPVSRAEIDALFAQADTLKLRFATDLTAAPELLHVYREIVTKDPNNETARSAIEDLLQEHITHIADAMQAQNMDLARQWADSARSTFPQIATRERFIKLEERLKQAEEIRGRLGHAEELLAQKALLEPAGQNAAEIFRDVLTVDGTNVRATQGLHKVANELHNQARSAWKANDSGKALVLIGQGLGVEPGHTELKALQQEISKQQKPADAAPRAAPAPSSVTSSGSSRISELRVSGSPMTSLGGAQGNVKADRTIHIGFRYNSFSDAATVLQAVLYDSTRSRSLAQVPVVITGSSGQNFFRVDRPVEGFPSGRYNVDLLQNGKVITTVEFIVAQ